VQTFGAGGGPVTWALIGVAGYVVLSALGPLHVERGCCRAAVLYVVMFSGCPVNRSPAHLLGWALWSAIESLDLWRLSLEGVDCRHMQAIEACLL